MKLLDVFRSLGSLGFRRRHLPELREHVSTWDLVAGHSVLGVMEFVGYETPWITAAFSPTPEFWRWVPLIKWREQADAVRDDEDGESDPPPEVFRLLAEAEAAAGLVAIERGDPGAPTRSIFHFTDDFKAVTLR